MAEHKGALRVFEVCSLTRPLIKCDKCFMTVCDDMIAKFKEKFLQFAKKKKKNWFNQFGCES